MNNTMEYKGYIGSVELSEKDKCFFGRVQGIRDLVLYEGKDAIELINDFHESIDEYIEYCKEQNKEPEKAYKGTFNVRVNPELHKGAAVYAINHDMTLNKFVEKAMEQYLPLNIKNADSI